MRAGRPQLVPSQRSLTPQLASLSQGGTPPILGRALGQRHAGRAALAPRRPSSATWGGRQAGAAGVRAPPGPPPCRGPHQAGHTGGGWLRSLVGRVRTGGMADCMVRPPGPCTAAAAAAAAFREHPWSLHSPPPLSCQQFGTRLAAKANTAQFGGTRRANLASAGSVRLADVPLRGLGDPRGAEAAAAEAAAAAAAEPAAAAGQAAGQQAAAPQLGGAAQAAGAEQAAAALAAATVRA